MKVFTLQIEVNDDDTTDDVAGKLESVARAMRKQSRYSTFLEDAGYGGNAITGVGIDAADAGIRGTWSLDP